MRNADIHCDPTGLSFFEADCWKMVKVVQSLNVQQLKYRHYREYVQGWFDIYNEDQRNKFDRNENKPCILSKMTNKKYNKKRVSWEKQIKENTPNKFYNVNQSITSIIKDIPKAFKKVYPPPTNFIAYNVKSVAIRDLKCLINRLIQIPSFYLIKYETIEYQYIDDLLYHCFDAVYIQPPILSSTDPLTIALAVWFYIELYHY